MTGQIDDRTYDHPAYDHPMTTSINRKTTGMTLQRQ
eukprot:CAMPEP_0113404290 /NCGR_PEP_ID=MMETSP0013_2-20120614/18301_1 /TAXON_ID=2843 ORGANISM="Skeletonema costatum, Strain 1716" /NCGR_SAMPLE_ID=MMETSP0013_2 /ASSEMBLY_ACC=CAM_ASM_000158 /LENGTH=35 /DNA_ID=CAMNT_0000289863 /DNA_START=127 /DNA_END=234 /DNA_ORIENTATION=- /assembly_acc=CAM_ASM_000158